MIPLILVGVSHSTTSNSFIKPVAAAEVSTDDGGISGLCMGARARAIRTILHPSHRRGIKGFDPVEQPL